MTFRVNTYCDITSSESFTLICCHFWTSLLWTKQNEANILEVNWWDHSWVQELSFIINLLIIKYFSVECFFLCFIHNGHVVVVHTHWPLVSMVVCVCGSVMDQWPVTRWYSVSWYVTSALCPPSFVMNEWWIKLGPNQRWEQFVSGSGLGWVTDQTEYPGSYDL